MAYNPLTDFVALLRKAGSNVSLAEMPGLDFVIAAMARAGMFQLWTGQDAPVTNQNVTAWLKPSSPSWVAEGTMYLYDPNAGTWNVATPALWANFFANVGSTSVFQAVTAGASAVSATATLLAVKRTAPTVTALSLPSVTTRTRPLHLVDWSSGVVNHTIGLIPFVGETIMRLSGWSLLSTSDQLAGATLIPSSELQGWVIAP